jgi:Flp pilus assembly protein TadD
VAVALHLHTTRSVVGLALENMRRNQLGTARQDLEHALRAAPEDPYLLSCYGWCVAQLGEVDRGIGLCERALRLQPQEMLLRLNLGRAYRLAGENKMAHRLFLRTWQQNKHDPAPAAELARMGIRRTPVLRFLPRGHWCNRALGMLRTRLARARGDSRIRHRR